MREYMKRKREEKKLLTVNVTKEGNVNNLEWDKEKYPEKGAWEIAVARVERAKRYAEMFPHLIHASDLAFQDLDWQYEHEGLPAVRKKETHLVT